MENDNLIKANPDNDLMFRQLLMTNNQKRYTSPIPMKEGELLEDGSNKPEKIEYFVD